MVLLLPIISFAFYIFIYNLNSTMVLLLLTRCFGLVYFLIKFKFHYGATSTRNYVLFLLGVTTFKFHYGATSTRGCSD